jgi:lysozyme
LALLTNANVLTLLAHFGLADDPVAVIGISGADGKNDIGVYDDEFYHFVNGKVTAFAGNVDPSRQAKGRATLQPMKVFHWRAGIHGLSKPADRRYAAFVQAEPVTVIRYQMGADTGLFGINHHRGGVNGTSSLGCQTYPPKVWDAARANLYGAIGATVKGVNAGKREGKPFPYVVIPLPRAKEILGGAKPKTDKVTPIPPAPAWTIRIKGKDGEADEVYESTVNIGGRVFVPARDFCVSVLDCKPDEAPLKWKDGPGETDVLTVSDVEVSEFTEIEDRAYVWIVDMAKALGYSIQKVEAAKNLILYV